MAPDEYSTGGGGKLKLKGSKVSDGRVDKKKKKKAKKEKDAAQGDQAEQAQRSQRQESGEADSLRDESRERDEQAGSSAAKTEAERKYEEVRRKRVRYCLSEVVSALLYFCGVSDAGWLREIIRPELSFVLVA